MGQTSFTTWLTKVVGRILPAATLYLVAPLVAEFLLGNMSITHLGLLVILAPVYGGAAVLIRECVRRTGRGWPSIFLLALAYGVFEEAFLTESLFNPNYLGQNLHLLKAAFIPSLGVGAWYTVFVLTLHTVWSISVPIALIEALVPERSESPWIGSTGIGVITAIFVLVCFSMRSFFIRVDPNHFVASPAQLAWSTIIIFGLITLAFSIPRGPTAKNSRRVPDPRIAGIVSFAIASTFLLVPPGWGWWAVGTYFSIDALTIGLILICSSPAGWRPIHRLSLAGGAAMAYAWHAFVLTPSLGNNRAIARTGNFLFAVLAAILIAAGAAKVGNFRDSGRMPQN